MEAIVACNVFRNVAFMGCDYPVTPYKPNLSFGQRKKRYKKLLVIENTFISLFILVKFKVVRDFINKSHFQKKIAKKLNGKWF